jgi:hypothetical protein
LTVDKVALGLDYAAAFEYEREAGRPQVDPAARVILMGVLSQYGLQILHGQQFFEFKFYEYKIQ